MIPSGIDVAGMVKRIREDILHIDIPIQHALQNINLYLFLGEYPALIDTGPYHPLLEGIIVEALRFAGIEGLAFIYLTHSHIDHSGMAARMRRMTGAKVATHRYERPRVEHVDERLREEYACYSSMSARMGFPEEIASQIFNLASVWISLSEPCPVDIRLGGGERVRAGDHELEVVHTPGHTAGHVCYYLAREGLLFSGDHLMRTITPNPELYCPPWRGNMTGLTQFLDSLRLLEDYDVRHAYPGHGRAVHKVQKRIEMNLVHHERRLAKTREAVDKGCRTVWEVALRLFPQVRNKPPDVDHFLALKEALGHLLILEEQGAVQRGNEGELWVFTTT
ncbi:MAG: MBL fold metallo-hydrolase [Actinobacteria bacterium]|jgi:glyoxylase-like metal-dependent hydrolase (beta-lactamase superfamily II)|nr:MAG: MBL fold metallo-hydrolase [Actinomycetota bacterium]